MDRDEINNLYSGPSIDASYQVSVHLANECLFVISSPCQRQCELLPSLGVRRLSSVNFSHFNLLWQPCLLMDREEMSNLYRGPPIDDTYQVLVHLAKQGSFKLVMQSGYKLCVVTFGTKRRRSLGNVCKHRSMERSGVKCFHCTHVFDHTNLKGEKSFFLYVSY
jgi:hypothetical protein